MRGGRRRNAQSWIYLFRRFCFDKLLINLLGSWRHSEWRLNLLVVLTGEPELNILIAVFRFQKVAKSGQPIWGKHKKHSQRELQTTLLVSLKKDIYIYMTNTIYCSSGILVLRGKGNLHLDSRSLSSDCDHCWVSSKLSLLGENAS